MVYSIQVTLLWFLFAAFPFISRWWCVRNNCAWGIKWEDDHQQYEAYFGIYNVRSKYYRDAIARATVWFIMDKPQNGESKEKPTWLNYILRSWY